MARKKLITDDRYHDTLLLLKKYRDVTWSLTVAVEQAKSDFRDCYGGSIDEFLDSIYLAGADLGGTDIEERAKSIERSNKMLKLVDSAVNIMRIKHKTGDLYYHVLYFNFLSPNEYRTNEAIVDALEEAGYPMCYRTMTTYRTVAYMPGSRMCWVDPMGLYSEGDGSDSGGVCLRFCSIYSSSLTSSLIWSCKMSDDVI